MLPQMKNLLACWWPVHGKMFLKALVHFETSEQIEKNLSAILFALSSKKVF